MQVRWKVSKSWEKNNSHHLLKALMFPCFSGLSSRVFGNFSRPRTKNIMTQSSHTSENGIVMLRKLKKKKQNYTTIVIPLRTAFSFPTMASCLFIQNQTLSSCLIAVVQAANIYLIVNLAALKAQTASGGLLKKKKKIKASLWRTKTWT